MTIYCFYTVHATLVFYGKTIFTNLIISYGSTMFEKSDVLNIKTFEHVRT